MALIARDQLGPSQQEMEERMDVLMTLVPDLGDRLSHLSPSVLEALLQTPLDHLAERIITLKELFPAADVSHMLGRAPSLLLQSSPSLRQSARDLRDVMRTEQVDELVAEQPMCMDVACVKAALGELRLLMPGANVRKLVLQDPSWLLRAQRGQQWRSAGQ